MWVEFSKGMNLSLGYYTNKPNPFVLYGEQQARNDYVHKSPQIFKKSRGHLQITDAKKWHEASSMLRAHNS
jgi:hypothetical protein